MSSCRGKRKRGQKLSEQAILDAFRDRHGNKYQYPPFPDTFTVHSRISIICPVHGEFRQIITNHMKGQGCPECGKTKQAETFKRHLITRREFEQKARAVHGLMFEYSELPVEFSLDDNIIIYCNEHNHVFFGVAREHLNGKGCEKQKRDFDIYQTIVCNTVKRIQATTVKDS